MGKLPTWDLDKGIICFLENEPLSSSQIHICMASTPKYDLLFPSLQPLLELLPKFLLSAFLSYTLGFYSSPNGTSAHSRHASPSWYTRPPGPVWLTSSLHVGLSLNVTSSEKAGVALHGSLSANQLYFVLQNIAFPGIMLCISLLSA